MFSSTILDVVVGLIFAFLAVSLAASAVTEALASALKWRSSTLVQSIKDLLNDQRFTGLAQAIYTHALVSPLDNGTRKTEAEVKSRNPPSYIDPANFAQALMQHVNVIGVDMSPQAIKQRILNSVGDEQLRTLLNGIVDIAGTAAVTAVRSQIQTQLQPGPVRDALTNIVDRISDPNHLLDVATIHNDLPPGPVRDGVEAIANRILNSPGALAAAAIRQQLQAIGDAQLKTLLNTIIDGVSGDIDKIRDEIAKWFDSAMDRVSGIYKRWTQAWNFGIALLLAAVLNISAIQVAWTLWEQPMITKDLDRISLTGTAAQPAKNGATEQLPTPADVLNGLAKLPFPIGWTSSNLCPEQTSLQCSRHVLALFLGWIITAFATLFGAPFWFDTLQSIIRLKGSGPSPKEKSTGASAAA